MIRAFVLDGPILLTEVKILESTHLCYHKVISVVIANCCRNGKKSRHGILSSEDSYLDIRNIIQKVKFSSF